MNIMEYCNCFYNFHRIPIYYYEKGKCLYRTGSSPEDVEVPRQIAAKLLDERKDTDIYESVIASWYGEVKIRETGESFIIGPIKENGYSEQDFHKFCFSYHIPSEKRAAYKTQFLTTPSCSVLRFRYLIRSLQEAFGEERRMPGIYENYPADDSGEMDAQKP